MRAQRPGDILVVDSDEYFLNNVANLLRDLGHRVETATSAHAARLSMENAAFDVVVCAYRLPDQRGTRLCHFVKSDEKRGSTFVALMLDLSMDGSEGEAVFAEHFSVNAREHDPFEPDDIILKPVRAAALAGRLLILLRMKRYHQECQLAIKSLQLVASGVEEQLPQNENHGRRLALMAFQLGAALNCDDYSLRAVERAAYLHDVGMSAVPGSIVGKNGPLSADERTSMQTHTIRGWQMCQPLSALRAVLPIIRSHHEKLDGSGYPDQKRGDSIPHLAQVFAIPHVYEALRSPRHHRADMNHETALQILNDEVKAGWWNAEIYQAFVNSVIPNLESALKQEEIDWRD